MFWHNRLFAVGYLYLKFCRTRTIFGLISASRDGAWLAAFFRLIGLNAIRGSSSWRGAQALRELINVVDQGGDIAITPDGPRGPCYDFKKGALMVVRKARCPVLLFSCTFSNAWRLKSWDGFYLPKPFSMLSIHCRYLPAGAIPEAAYRDAAVFRDMLVDLTTD